MKKLHLESVIEIMRKECSIVLDPYGQIVENLRIPLLTYAKLLDEIKRCTGGVSSGTTMIKEILGTTVTLLPYSEIAEIVSGALAKAIVYIEERKENEQINEKLNAAIPLAKDIKQNKFSVDTLIALVSLLFSIYVFIISTQPNEQLDRIIAQQEQQTQLIEAIEEKQDTIIELSEEETRLRDTLEALTDSINSLTETIDGLRDQLEEMEQPGDDIDQVCNGQTDENQTEAHTES